MEKILLVMASARNRRSYINQLPPLGILYLASFLEKNGFSVDVIDCNIDKFDVNKVREYDLIGFSINVANIENSVKLINFTHQIAPDVPIIAGGPLPTVSPAIFFPLPLKAIFVSESEYSLMAYLRDINANDGKGFYFKNPSTGQWNFNGAFPYIADLDALPFPALDKINLHKYYTPIKKEPYVSSLVSSRGCPFSCTFCCKTLGSDFRKRSPENVISEIEWQVNVLGVKEIAIYDDNFTLDNERAEKICDLVLEKNIMVSFQLTNGIRVDTLSFDLLSKMKKAGFWIIAVAPESGNKITLEKIRKGYSLFHVEQTVKWCNELKIKVWAFFMIGFPWESVDMVMKTVNFARKIKVDMVHFSKVTPLPGTELYNRQLVSQTSVWPFKDISLFNCSQGQSFYNLPDNKVNKLISQAYRKVYLANPGKIVKLASLFSPRDLLATIWFAAKGRNIF